MKKFLLITAAVLFAYSAQAADAPKVWLVDPAQSKLTFTGEQNGEKFSGGFKTFAASVTLDPDHPETGKVDVLVDTASAYAGSSDRDGMLPQKEWFNTAKFPQAEFATTAIRKTGPFKYEADATLTIKGLSKNVTLPFTLAPEGDHWHATGHVLLMRNDFAVGTGSFAGEDYVKHAVDVAIDIVAK